jgi:hypothetical protein
MSDNWTPIINDLEKRNITTYHISPANGCTMVSYGSVVAYYYVKDNEVVDIIYD